MLVITAVRGRMASECVFIQGGFTTGNLTGIHQTLSGGGGMGVGGMHCVLEGKAGRGGD